jgi:TonB family protein
MESIDMNKPLIITISLVITIAGYVLAQAVNSNTSSVDRPVVITAAVPIYPQVARAGLITDDVVVEGSIHPSGVFITTNVIQGHKVFHKAAEDAARRWRFEPYTHPADGKFRTARLTFSFRIMPAETPEADLLPIFYPPYKIEVRSVINRIM